jgi:hypothetical protein
MKKPIFREESVKRISSAEQLNDYIRVSNPGIWIVALAFLVLIAGAAVWSVTSRIESNVTTFALMQDGEYVAYVSPETAAAIKPGIQVELGDGKEYVRKIESTPLSYEEVRRTLSSDYAAHALGLGDWNVRITITTDNVPGADGDMAPLTVTTANERPIDLIF